MPTIDAHGNVHGDHDGQFQNKNQPAAGFDLDTPVPAPLPDDMKLVDVTSLREGDLADLEPLLIAYGARDDTFEGDLLASESELANVESVTPNADGSVTIYTDQMNLAVPADTRVAVMKRSLALPEGLPADEYAQTVDSSGNIVWQSTVEPDSGMLGDGEVETVSRRFVHQRQDGTYDVWTNRFGVIDKFERDNTDAPNWPLTGPLGTASAYPTFRADRDADHGDLYSISWGSDRYMAVEPSGYVSDAEFGDATPDEQDRLVEYARQVAQSISDGPEMITQYESRYFVEEQLEQIHCTDPSDPGGTELDADYTYGEGSYLAYNSVDKTMTEAKRMATATTADMLNFSASSN